MNNVIKVSLVVAAYQSSEFIAECLYSVLHQDIEEWECIIIDDGSLDNTYELALGFSEIDSRFKVYQLNNCGPSKARNFGVSMAKGKYVLTLDSDDHISENYCRLCLDEFEKSQDLVVVYGSVQNFGTVNDFQFDGCNFFYRDHLLSNKIHVSGMYLKSNFLHVNGFDETMLVGYEDWEFYIRLLKNGGNVKQLKDAILYYRRKYISRNTNLEREKNDRTRVMNYIFTKNITIYEKFFPSALDVLVCNEKLKSPEIYYSYKGVLFILLVKIKKSIRKYLINFS